MATRTNRPRTTRARPVRQSVTIPEPLASEVRRVAKERHLTMSRALVSLAERGIQAEQDAKENLKAAYKRFMDEQEPALVIVRFCSAAIIVFLSEISKLTKRQVWR
jgi:hypothetical protein